MAQDQVNKTKLVVIGGSSGSLEVLIKILPLLRSDVGFPILLIMHRNASADSELTELLASRSKLKVKEAEDKELMEQNCVYIAPADYHVLVESDGTLSLDVSERVHYCRPSIDVSFMSAALAFNKQVLAILLSGANADGAAGIKSIKEYGGVTVVQDPAEASVAYMPEQAILTNAVDRIMQTGDIAAWLNGLAAGE
jgi:two-component system chemotaxis response regulator CheB